MRCPALLLALSLVALPLSSRAVTIDWALVGHPGNAPDVATNCGAPSCGSVAYPYRIARHEVTNAQYAEFLNAKAAADPLELYDPRMGSDELAGGITRSGAPGSYVYELKPGFADKPVMYVSFYDALRFANWLHNGQGDGDTETGAYTLLGGTPEPSNGASVTRNPDAIVFLPSENEWYKAAYGGAGGSWFDFPTRSNAPPACVAPDADDGNAANCLPATGVPALADVGSYPLSASPWGTFDQGGGGWEWNEQIVAPPFRGVRGGGWNTGATHLAASYWVFGVPTEGNDHLTFRVAAVIECADGLDDDGDGLADLDDPGCGTGWIEMPQCQDGLDNDGQPGIDFDGGASLDLDGDGFVDAAFNPQMPAVGAPDPECAGQPSRNSERGSCGLGAELALLLPLLARPRRGRRRA
ncbi:MAG TPA: SUMF1/EgtB/PvdO family nonheme iron enzyme [Myxococcota bacterium]